MQEDSLGYMVAIFCLKIRRGDKMTPRIKLPVVKPEDLSFQSWITHVERENRLPANAPHKCYGT